MKLNVLISSNTQPAGRPQVAMSDIVNLDGHSVCELQLSPPLTQHSIQRRRLVAARCTLGIVVLALCSPTGDSRWPHADTTL